MPKIKKTFKYILSFVLPFTFCMICFGLVWFQYLQDVPTKSSSWLFNDRYDSLSSPLDNGHIFSQEFTVNGPVYGFGLNFNVIDTSLDGTLKVQLFNTDTGEQLMNYESNFAPISPVSYTGFTLDTPITEKGKYNLRLTIQANYLTPEVYSGQMLSLKKSSNVAEGFGSFQENGQEAGGSLAMLIISDIIGDLPVKYFWCVGIGSSIAVSLLALFFMAMPEKKALGIFLTLFTVCTIYQFVLPTFSAPDEATHYNTAYDISNCILGIDYSLGEQKMIKRETDTHSAFTDYNTSAFTYRHMMNQFTKSADEEAVLETVYRPYLRNYRYAYILPSIGITFGRVMNMNGVITAMLARLTNTIVFCIAVTMAWYLAPFGKMIFVAIALLPITVHIGSSISYDSLTISLSFILIALSLRCIFRKTEISIKEMVFLSSVCILLVPLKSVYFLPAVLVAVIPNSNFKTNKQAWIYKIRVLGLAFIHYAHYNLNSFKYIFALPASAAVAEAATGTSAVAAAVEAIPNFTIGYMLSHPGILLKLVINTFFTKFTLYFNSMIGGTLGYIDLAEISINPLILIGFVCILFISVIPDKNDVIFNISQRIIALLIFVMTLAMLIGVCVTWTPMDYDYIWGFQGRYLLPVLPLALFGIQSKVITKNKDITNILLSGLVVLNIFTVLNAFIVIFSR